MIFMRRRPIARAAVVGGAAYAAGKHVANNRAQDEMQQQQIDDLKYAQMQAAQQAQQPAATAPVNVVTQSNGDDLTVRLEKLNQLKNSGALSEQEFQAAKMKLLNA